MPTATRSLLKRRLRLWQRLSLRPPTNHQLHQETFSSFSNLCLSPYCLKYSTFLMCTWNLEKSCLNGMFQPHFAGFCKVAQISTNNELGPTKWHDVGNGKKIDSAVLRIG